MDVFLSLDQFLKDRIFPHNCFYMQDASMVLETQ